MIDGIVATEDKLPHGKTTVRYTVLRSGQLIWNDRVTPEELEAIAKDMRERSGVADLPFGISEQGE